MKVSELIAKLQRLPLDEDIYIEIPFHDYLARTGAVPVKLIEGVYTCETQHGDAIESGVVLHDGESTFRYTIRF